MKEAQGHIQPGAHTLKLHNIVSFGETLASHANAQAHSIKLQASAEHNTGSGQARRGKHRNTSIGTWEHEKKKMDVRQVPRGYITLLTPGQLLGQHVQAWRDWQLRHTKAGAFITESDSFYLSIYMSRCPC
jgi:hypothetical protein